MSEKDSAVQNPGQDPTPGGGDGAPTSPPATPVSPTQPGTPPNPSSNPGAGGPYEKLYNDMRSRAIRAEKELDDERARLGAEIKELKQQLAERDNAITQLNANVAKLADETAEIPNLQKRIKELTREAELGRKFRSAMNYPDLLTVQVEEEVEGQDEPVVTNPVLSLIESSNLEGEALEAVLRQMNAALPQQSGTPAPTTPPPTAPAPAEPLEDDSPEFWEREVDRIHKAMIEHPDDMSLIDRYLEATRKAKTA